MEHVQRPRPQPRGEERRYFADLREGRLPLYRCTSCQVLQAHPFVRCPACAGAEGAREWSAGRGAVYSFTVLQRPGHPAFADRVPYTIALVDLDEGVRSLADLRLPEGVEPSIGQRVVAGFDDLADGELLLHFVPEEAL
jgi:uncharacterized OB-fold protein